MNKIAKINTELQEILGPLSGEEHARIARSNRVLDLRAQRLEEVSNDHGARIASLSQYARTDSNSYILLLVSIICVALLVVYVYTTLQAEIANLSADHA